MKQVSTYFKVFKPSNARLHVTVC